MQLRRRFGATGHEYRVNPILGVADESTEQAVLERLLELNQALSPATV